MMKRLRAAFGLLLLGVLASCRAPEAEAPRDQKITTIEQASAAAQKHLGELRFDELRRDLGREHTDHRILLGLPELTAQANRSRVQAEKLAGNARETAELAMAYNVQLLAPDDAAAQGAGEKRVRQNLRLETELAAESYLSLRQQLEILKRASGSASFPESGRRELTQVAAELDETALWLRTLSGVAPGSDLELRRGAIPAAPLWGDLLAVALEKRPEFKDSPLSAKTLAQLIRRAEAKLPPEVDPGNRTAVLLARSEFLLRFPRFYAERRLSDLRMPPALRQLALGLVLDAELKLDLAAYEAARSASVEAADSPVKDYESELAHKRARRAEYLALRRLRNTLGLDEGENSPPPFRDAGTDEDLDRTIEILLEMMGKEK